ncbi:uncharacterized protein A4U43_C05F15960 [Asparagus officinalis]|uniref:Uncharacterized protein n=1 Tax=Asparagus officinalis TaxID=4686 RepID=A0A5P1ESK4_ASPOF|nr:uncharacterized protein A4U43_C05F15960 [Asparagus officinalis]
MCRSERLKLPCSKVPCGGSFVWPKKTHTSFLCFSPSSFSVCSSPAVNALLLVLHSSLSSSEDTLRRLSLPRRHLELVSEIPLNASDVHTPPPPSPSTDEISSRTPLFNPLSPSRTQLAILSFQCCPDPSLATPSRATAALTTPRHPTSATHIRLETFYPATIA